MLKDAVLVKSKPFVLNSSGKFPPTTSPRTVNWFHSLQSHCAGLGQAFCKKKKKKSFETKLDNEIIFLTDQTAGCGSIWVFLLSLSFS